MNISKIKTASFFALSYFFATNLSSLNFCHSIYNKADNFIDYCVKNTANSEIFTDFCNYLLNTAKDLEESGAFEGNDWHDVALNGYKMGVNPKYPQAMALYSGCLLQAGLVASDMEILKEEQVSEKDNGLIIKRLGGNSHKLISADKYYWSFHDIEICQKSLSSTELRWLSLCREYYRYPQELNECLQKHIGSHYVECRAQHRKIDILAVCSSFSSNQDRQDCQKHYQGEIRSHIECGSKEGLSDSDIFLCEAVKRLDEPEWLSRYIKKMANIAFNENEADEKIIRKVIRKYYPKIFVRFTYNFPQYKNELLSLHEKIKAGDTEKLKNIILDPTTFDSTALNEFVQILISECKEQSDWKKYIVQADGIMEMYSSSQKAYGSLMSVTSTAVASLIKNGANYEKVATIAVLGRFLMGSHKGERNKHGFKRNDLMGTVFKGSYKNLGIRANEKIDSGEWKSLENFIYVKEREASPGCFEVQIFGDIGGETYKLSEFWLPNYRDGELIHTTPAVLEATNHGFEHLQALFDNALKQDNELELIKKLGEFFWWYCQIKPVTFGDPSIAEIMIKGALKAKGFKVPAWKPGIFPWVEAMLEYDAKIFGDKFHELLDYSEEIPQN